MLMAQNCGPSWVCRFCLITVVSRPYQSLQVSRHITKFLESRTQTSENPLKPTNPEGVAPGKAPSSALALRLSSRMLGGKLGRAPDSSLLDKSCRASASAKAKSLDSQALQFGTSVVAHMVCPFTCSADHVLRTWLGTHGDHVLTTQCSVRTF